MRRALSPGHDLLKHLPLLTPVELMDDGAEISLVEAFDLWQKQDLFLQVGSELQQFRNLGHSGACHAS